MDKLFDAHSCGTRLKEAFLRSKTSQKHTTQGRSMIEMLGVIAIVGVISIIALFGYSYAMNKHKANLILNDISLAFAELVMKDENIAPIERQSVSFKPESGLPVQIARTDAYWDLVYVESVPQKVCQILLQYRTTDIYDNIYNEDLNELTSCNEPQTMVFGRHEPLPECADDSDVQKMLEKYDLTSEQKNFITKLVLPSGTTSFCREFSENVVNKIEENSKIFADSAERTERCQIHNVIKELGYNYASQTVEKCEELPYYGKILSGSTMGAKANPKNDEERFGKISNPTVHIALNQTRVVVNALIKEYGKPTQVVIEVSRDLKASREAKNKMQQKIAANQRQNEILNKKIKDANSSILFPNRTDRLKYKLWEELDPENALNRRCVYCGKQISGADIFNDNTVQIEHILPFGRTLWDSEHNKTIAHTKCNAFKGENTPYEAFFKNPKGYNWNEILERASHLKDPQKRRLFSENAMETFEKESGFISRQLTDNAYLSKMALKYLKCVVEKDSNACRNERRIITVFL